MSILVGEGYFIWNNIRFNFDTSSPKNCLVWSYDIMDGALFAYEEGRLVSSSIESGLLFDHGYRDKKYAQRFEINRYARGSGVKFELEVWGYSLEEVLTRGFSVGKQVVFERD